MHFETAEEYAVDKDNIKYVNQMQVPSDMVNKWYNIHYNFDAKKNPKTVIENRIDKINNIYDGGKLDVVGKALELGFCFGESLYVLQQWYPDVVFDALDFCPLFSKLIPLIKGLLGKNIDDMWIGDAQQIPKPDNYYDFINSASFFEHLPEDVYLNTLRECMRVLKPGKIMGVYLDHHAGFVSIEQTKKELISNGFISVTDYIFRKPL